ncbi:FAD/NAD(P)-binding domain-containing protein [Aspergillus indologenus CBS 114.80]|uniref:FAD/NAD(P)-binding domain-containing protein n=1 Tax=Aspergillus indologenus CBS 114.80 TaxID=1450541 RepID=A0A2V5HTT3_9EURO|nr:FAD/NAD(P)-binding domain-containing protein [Aspergillus indologenus CBS 114.80]
MTVTHPTNRYDVLVVGGGNAALVAALSAHHAGARVAIFEAASQAERGGNSRFSSGIFRIPHDGLDSLKHLLHPKAAADVAYCRMRPYTAEMYRGDVERTSKGQCDRAQLAVMLAGAFETVTWMSQTLGVKWQLPLGKFFDREKIIRAQGTVDMPPWDTIMAIGEGTGLMADLWAAVEQRPEITVFHSAPVADLIAEGDTIRGLRVRHRETTAEYFGQVILGCGGFEASARLRRQYLGEGWDLVSLRGSRFNTGRMMEKAVAAGAGMAGHFGGCHATPHDLHAPKVLDPSDCDKMSRYSFPYSVLVNTEGRRFLDEGEDHFSLTYAKTGAAIVRQPQATAFQVFDQKTLHLLEPRYATSKPIHADTLDELAQKMGVDAANFAETIRQYNAATPPDAVEKFNAFALDHVSTGTALAIPKSNWALPIDQGPFVAYGVTCGITFTYGGLRTDDAAHVLNEEGLVMPGLWAVGEIAGGFFAFNYPGGSGLTKGAVFGKIAGAAAAERAKTLRG